MVYDVYGLWFLDCWLLIWVLKLVSSGLWCLWSFIPQWESSKSASTYIYIYSPMKRDRWPSPKDKVHHGISSSLWLKLVIFLYNYVYNIVFIFIHCIYTVYIYICIIYDICVCMYIPIHIPFTDEESLCFNGWFQGALLQVKGQNLGCRLKVSATAPNAPRCHRCSKLLGVDFWVDWLDTKSMARTLVSLVSGAVKC